MDEATAQEMGRKAFEAGKMAVPALDRDFVRALPRGPIGASLPLLDAWARGWHRANAAAPVPGVTDTEEWAGRPPEG